MKEPEIVTEIYRLGHGTDLTVEQVAMALATCKTAGDVNTLLRSYVRGWLMKYGDMKHPPVEKLMTEEEFAEWVESRSSLEQLEEKPIQEMTSEDWEEVGQEIVGSPEQTPVELPYALKVEMLVHDMRDLLARQDALEQKVERQGGREAGHRAGRKAVREALRVREAKILANHETLHDNLDADLTELHNRVTELEAIHRHD